jgi:hypothetical protein
LDRRLPPTTMKVSFCSASYLDALFFNNYRLLKLNQMNVKESMSMNLKKESLPYKVSTSPVNIMYLPDAQS